MANANIVINPIKYLSKLPEFNGDSRELQTFIELIDRVHPFLQTFNEESQLFFSDLIKSRLRGRARETIEINCHAVSWTEIKEILQTNFGNRKSVDELFDELRATIFNTNSVDFYNEIKSKLRKLNNKTLIVLGAGEAANECARNNMRTALNLFKSKIPEPMKTILFCRNPTSLESAMDILFEAGCAYKTSQIARNSPPHNHRWNGNQNFRSRNDQRSNNNNNRLNYNHNNNRQSHNNNNRQNYNNNPQNYNNSRQNYNNNNRQSFNHNNNRQNHNNNRQNQNYNNDNRQSYNNNPNRNNNNHREFHQNPANNQQPQIANINRFYQPPPEPMDINKQEIQNFPLNASRETFPFLINPNLCNPKWNIDCEKVIMKTLKNEVTINEKVRIPLFKEIGNQDESIEFFVCKFHDRYDGLIGNDILRRFDAKIDYKNNQLEINGNTLQLQYNSSESIYIKLNVCMFDRDETDTDTEQNVLNLAKKCLKKVPKQDDAQQYRVLILDDNELQKIDNIDSYLRIEKLSLCKNQLLRMYGVCRLHCLRELSLSFNGILTIEGLKELVHLTHLNLEGNNIKTIEHLNTNTKLEYLNLSENSIGTISDMSFLKCLKELYLHGNRLTHLRQCDKYLPVSLETLSLAKNNISDLNEICTLSGLSSLNNITINENPCVQMTGGTDGFDHRPFVLNWCMSLKTIDGFVVDPIESLKAEWLYSQGRGRQFRIGEQASLAKYLSSVCPLLGKPLENENERKLRLILSKAQQHQRQLQEEISVSVSSSNNNSPSTARKGKSSSRIQSPRFSRLSGRQGSPDSMSSSYHGNTSTSSFLTGSNETLTGANLTAMTTSLIENIRSDPLMTQSLDAANSSLSAKNTSNTLTQDTLRAANQCNADLTQAVLSSGPLAAASKMVPVPETLMSPDVCPTAVAQRAAVSSLNSQYITGSIPNKISKETRRNEHGSPKAIRSSHLKRNNERSPILSPRKVMNSNSNNVQILKSCIVDNSHAKAKHTHGTVQITPPSGSSALSSDEDSDYINIDKLKTIRNKAAQKSQQQKENMDISAVKVNNNTETSAVLIQKIWRGYYTRKKTKDLAEEVMKKRTQEYIEKLSKDMEMTKAQLENERKIQQLQMQAINALWKRVSTMQSTNTAPVSSEESQQMISSQEPKNSIGLDNSSTAVVADLAKTCSMLTNQVQQLQGSMRDIVNCMTLFCGLPKDSLRKALNVDEQRDSSATQTEIVAVHTPQIDNHTFPFKIRPSSLPLETGDTVSNKLTDEAITEKDVNAAKEKTAVTDATITSSSNLDGSGEGQLNEDKLNAKNILNSSQC